MGDFGSTTEDIIGVLFLDKIVNAFRDISEDFWEFFALFWSEAAKYKINISHLFAQIIICSAKTKALEISGRKRADSRFEAIITAIGSLFAITQGTEI